MGIYGNNIVSWLNEAVMAPLDKIENEVIKMMNANDKADRIYHKENIQDLIEKIGEAVRG